VIKLDSVDTTNHTLLVLVHWRDAAGAEGWHTREEVLMVQPKRVESVGFLVHVAPTYIVLVDSLASCEEHDGEECMGPFVIPRSEIEGVEALGVVDDDEDGGGCWAGETGGPFQVPPDINLVIPEFPEPECRLGGNHG